MRQMRKADIHDILGITNNYKDQNQTRELVSTLMAECNVYSFNSYNSRDTFKNTLIREITSPRTRLCAAVLAAYANNRDTCIQALYGLARLIRKSRGTPSSILSPPTPASTSASVSVSRPVSTYTSAAPTPAPTFTQHTTYATGFATAVAPAAATASTMASSYFNYNVMNTNMNMNSNTGMNPNTGMNGNMGMNTNMNMNTITGMNGNMGMNTSIGTNYNMSMDSNMDLDTDMNTDISTPGTVSMTPSMTTSNVTPAESTEATTPENDAKCWIPEKVIWFRDLTNIPFRQALELRLSDLVGLPMVQTAKLLESIWVDSSALHFVRFAKELSEGLQVPVHDLNQIEIWLRIEDPITKAYYDITVPPYEDDLGVLEEAYHTILDDATEGAFNGVLPLADSPDAYDITRLIFLGEEP